MEKSSLSGNVGGSRLFSGRMQPGQYGYLRQCRKRQAVSEAETDARETAEQAAGDGEIITLKGFTMGNEPASGMDAF